jgi:hypothetical protein
MSRNLSLIGTLKISILDAFFRDCPLPPVEVTTDETGRFRYKVYNGMHRFYASIAVGFSHLPVVEIIDDARAFLEAEAADIVAWNRANR